MPEIDTFGQRLAAFASGSFWGRLTPATAVGQPSANQAKLLTGVLREWAELVTLALEAAPNPPPAGPIDSDPGLSPLLASLDRASEAILAFKRTGLPIEIPGRFVEVAEAVLARSDRDEDRTATRVARRFSAATSHLAEGRTRARIDERGRVFDDSGRRLFGFDPEKVRQGRREIEAGETHPLANPGEA